MTHFFSSRWLLSIISLTIFALLLAGCQQPTFTHQIQLEDATSGQPVAGAKIRAEMGTRDFVEAETDTNGMAQLAIQETYLDRWAKVIVETEDYPKQSFLVELLADKPTTVLQLAHTLEQPAAIQQQPIEGTAVATEDTSSEMDSHNQDTSGETAEPTVESNSNQETVPSGELANIPPAQRANYFQAKPDLSIEVGTTYQATIQTSKGDIVVSLDSAAAPEHVNNFIFLSKQGFYDGLTFHRVEPGFVIQGGDPEGTGQSGPGYTVPGEFELTHIEGALAMARLPDEINPERASSGSQFYITLAPTPFLDGQYSVFGKVEEGMDVVQSIQIGDVIEQIIVEP